MNGKSSLDGEIREKRLPPLSKVSSSDSKAD
jgi:hypothetical protein